MELENGDEEERFAAVHRPPAPSRHARPSPPPPSTPPQNATPANGNSTGPAGDKYVHPNRRKNAQVVIPPSLRSRRLSTPSDRFPTLSSRLRKGRSRVRPSPRGRRPEPPTRAPSTRRCRTTGPLIKRRTRLTLRRRRATPRPARVSHRPLSLRRTPPLFTAPPTSSLISMLILFQNSPYHIGRLHSYELNH